MSLMKWRCHFSSNYSTANIAQEIAQISRGVAIRRATDCKRGWLWEMLYFKNKGAGILRGPLYQSIVRQVFQIADLMFGWLVRVSPNVS